MHGTFSRSLVQPTTRLKKNLVKLDHFPTHGGEHTQKYLKPAPSFEVMAQQFFVPHRLIHYSEFVTNRRSSLYLSCHPNDATRWP